jgi:hypothetical protein
MRKYLMLLCILSITIQASAQLFGKKWVDGKLYHTSGEVFTGQIFWSPPEKAAYSDAGDAIYYRNDKNKDEYPIPASKILSFIIGADSFVVTHDESFRHNPFMHVLLNTPVKLYVSLSKRAGIPMAFGTGGGTGNVSLGLGFGGMIGRGTKKTYYYGSNPDSLTKLEKKEFINVMSSIMADKPGVVAKIKDKTFKYGNIEDLVAYYKNGQLPQKDSVGY